MRNRILSRYHGMVGEDLADAEAVLIFDESGFVKNRYCFLDSRLFVPKKWFGEDYAERRDKCKLPQDLSFKTKPQLAVEMLEKISSEGVIPFRYVAADSIYGNSPEFLDAVEKLPGVTYFVSLPRDTLCWLQELPVWGQQRTKRILIRGYQRTYDLRTHEATDSFGQRWTALSAPLACGA